jgi:hypothetical protein
MADTFAVSDKQRAARYDAAATAVTAVSADVRARISKKLAGGVPARFRTLFRQSWWDQAVDRHAAPAFAGIAADTIDDLTGDLDINLDDLDVDQRADAGARTVGSALVLLGSRGGTVRDRVRALHAQAQAEGWDSDRLADALGLDGDSSGVLSDSVSDSVGRSLATLLIEATAVAALGALASDTDAATTTKTWRTVGDDRVRSAHADADGQTVNIDEPFNIDDHDAQFPGDPDLPADLAIGCRCALEYTVAATDTTGSVDDLDEEIAMAATAATRQRGGYLTVPMTGLAGLDRDTFAVNGSRITVTVEPTAAEKQGLAAVADVPADLHVPLLDAGDVASFTPDARTALAGALATVAANTPPLSGTIAGTGYLETAGVTVGIVDCTGLGALRDQVVAALADMVPEPGEFIPTVVLSDGSVDATQIAGIPVHFNELRVHVGGTETLVFDLLGPIPTAPSPDTSPTDTTTPPAPADSTPPAETPPPAPPEAPMPNTNATVATYTSATGGNLTVPDGWRLVPATTTTAGVVFAETPAPGAPPAVDAPPAPALVDVTDADLEAEIAARAATAAAAASGGVPEDYLEEAAEETSGAIAEIAAELLAEAKEPEEPAETAPPLPPPAAAATRGRRRFATPPTDSPSVPAVDLSGVSDTDIEAEVARRAATAAAAAAGTPVDDLMPEAMVEATDLISEIADEVMTEPDEETTEPADPAAGTYAAGDVPAGDVIAPGPLVDYDWEGILAIEGVPTSDGRMFADGALRWRPLPLTLAAQTVTAPGHDGAVVCGSICEIERVGNTIVGRGKFSSTEAGQQARILIEEGALRGVSVDVASYAIAYTDTETDEVLDEQDLWTGEHDVLAVFLDAELMGATLTPWQAFADARVDLTDPVTTSLVAVAGSPGLWRLSGPALFTTATDTQALVASAAPSVPAPSASLFALKPDTREPFSVRAPLPDGTIPVYGLLADWNIPHIGFDGRKVYPPRGDDFALFYSGKHVMTREGTRIPTGPIFIDTVHPNLALQASDAQAFYAHTGSAVADVHLYNGEHGIVAAGVLRPGTDDLAEYRFRGSDVSPDWRPVNGQHRMVAILAVNASGFPVRYVEGIAASAGRLRPWVAYDDTTGEPLAMVAVGAVHRKRKTSEVLTDLGATVAAQAAQIASLESKVQLLSAATFATTEPPVAVDLVEPVVDDGPVELSGDERAARAGAAMASLGLDRESRRRRALTAMGITGR